MPDTILSPEAKVAILALQKQLEVFLLQFTKLPMGSPEYLKHVARSVAVKALLNKLRQTDLDALTAPQTGKETQTPKEDVKNRRDDKKEANKGDRDARKQKREAKKVERKKQNNDESGSKEEGLYRFEELKAIWDSFEFDKITEGFREYLNDAEAFIVKANNFIGYAEVFAEGHFTKEIEQVKALMEKAQKFLAIARNISQQVDRYAKLAQQVVSTTLSIPGKIEDLKGNLMTEAQKIFAAAKQFIATADVSDPEIKLNVEKLQEYLTRGQEKLGKLEALVGLALADENGNNLPDWYDKIEKKYQEFLAGNKDLIPGTNIDDKVLVKITALKGTIERFIAEATAKGKELELQEKIKNLQQWLGELSKFITAITGFVDNIKEGDLVGIYEDLKDFKNFINSDKDILQGTKVDDKLKEKLQEYSKKAESWLMNKLTGGDPKKEGEVREILGLLDTLILSSGGVVDHSSKYEKDEDKITMPDDITAVSKEEAAELLKKYGISKPDASFEGILSDMKDEADAMMIKVNAKYKEALTRGAMASDAFKDAKDEYDDAVKKHEDYFKATNALGKKIITGLLGLAASFLAPGVGSVVTGIGAALLGDFDSVNTKIGELLPKEFAFVGDLAKEILPSILPRFGSEEGLIKIEGKELLAGLNDLYSNGVTVRYKEVYDLLNQSKGRASGLSKNLRKVEQADKVDPEGLKVVKNDVLILAKKWESLQGNVQKKYIDLPYPPIDKTKAYRNGSRYLYAIWLVRFPQKEIRIGDSMINQFTKFGVMSESKAEWSTGFWAKAGRGFFGFFGADPFDYRKELAKMKDWASKETDALKSAEAWKKVF